MSVIERLRRRTRAGLRRGRRMECGEGRAALPLFWCEHLEAASAARQAVAPGGPRETVSLERLMLRAMRAEAEARRVQWPKVLAADAAGHDSPDFRNLLRLAARAAPRVRDEVLALRSPALLTRPGLIARYDLMDMLVAFSQASGTAGGAPSLWLLVTQAGQGMPQIDGAVVPVIASANCARLTDPCLANSHRAGGRNAA